MRAENFIKINYNYYYPGSTHDPLLLFLLHSNFPNEQHVYRCRKIASGESVKVNLHQRTLANTT